MRQAVKYHTPTDAASPQPVEVRLLDSREFDSLADLRIAYEWRGNELLVLREERQNLLAQVRQYQDLYAQAVLDKQKLRGELILAERQIESERAGWESLPSKIHEVLMSWAEHARDCDDGCVAAIKVPADLHVESLVRSIGITGDVLVPAEELLHEAMDDRNVALVRVVAQALADEVSAEVPLVWEWCGHSVEECNPCLAHDNCVDTGKSCPTCVHEDDEVAS